MQFTAIIHQGAQLFGPASLPGSDGLLPSFDTDGDRAADRYETTRTGLNQNGHSTRTN